MKKIQDFGEKIGGARKDVWAARGLMLDDLMSMNSMERSKYAKKAYVWPVPNWEQMLSDGEDQGLLYWKNEMRKAFPANPYIRVSQKDDEEAIRAAQDAYVAFCAEYRAAVMAVSELSKVGDFCKEFLVANEYLIENKYGGYRYSVTPKAANCISNKMVHLAQIRNVRSLKAEAATKLFAIPKEKKAYTAATLRYQVFRYDNNAVKISSDRRETGIQIIISTASSKIYFYDYRGLKADDIEVGTYFVLDIKTHSVEANFKTEAEATTHIETLAQQAQEKENDTKDSPTKKTRKTSFSVKKLDRIQRTIPSHLSVHAGEKEFLQDLHFRACEFGNWLGEDERQKHLDLAYDSLADLADLLGVEHEDVSLNGTLALAFGSRGRGGAGAASAHYEPTRQVINLTKMNGAGCLAHEWAHGFDHFIAQKLGITASGYLSEKVFSQSSKYADKIPKAYVELIDLFTRRSTPVSDEEAARKKEQSLAQYALGLRCICNTYYPRMSATPETVNAWKECLTHMIDSMSDYKDDEHFQPLQDLADQLPARARRGFIKDILPRLSRFKKAIDTPLSEYKNVRGMSSQFLTGSQEFDKKFSKAGQGYWSSIIEMFARAFDCYIEDKLKQRNQHSDYLSSHASSFFTVIDVEKDESGATKACYAYAFPVGEERKAINEKFDELFEQIKDMGIFHRCETTPEPIQQSVPAIAEEPVPEPETEVAKAAPDSVQDQDSADETSAVSDVLTEHSEVVVRFLNCSAVATVTPKVMTMAQKREWNTAVFQVFKEPSQEHATELSTLREKIIGRNIPAYNLHQITTAAATMKAPAPVTEIPKTADIMQQTNVTVHQISFDELIRVAR